MLSGRANATPKDRDGTVGAIRALRVVRASAIKTRTQTINQLKSLIITAPAPMREALRSLTTAELRTLVIHTAPGPLALPGVGTETAGPFHPLPRPRAPAAGPSEVSRHRQMTTLATTFPLFQG